MLMGGLETATAGRSRRWARISAAMGEDALARFRRGHVGVVFQSFHLIPTMTALENVATPLELAGDRDAFDRAAAELDAMGLFARRDHYPAQLSGGEQQRVALARAAVVRPEILLADEPTGNLDSATGEAIIRLLFALRDRHGATLVLVHARAGAGRPLRPRAAAARRGAGVAGGGGGVGDGTGGRGPRALVAGGRAVDRLGADARA